MKTQQESGAVDKWTVLTYMARHALYEGTYRKYHDELGLENTAGTYLQIAADAAEQIIPTTAVSASIRPEAPETDYHALFESQT